MVCYVTHWEWNVMTFIGMISETVKLFHGKYGDNQMTIERGCS